MCVCVCVYVYVHGERDWERCSPEAHRVKSALYRQMYIVYIFIHELNVLYSITTQFEENVKILC